MQVHLRLLADVVFASGDPLVIATDGGSKDRSGIWAVTAADIVGRVQPQCMFAPLAGKYFTSSIAELEALRQTAITLWHVLEFGRAPLHPHNQRGGYVAIAVDCMPAIEFVEAESCPAERFQQWRDFRQAHASLAKIGVVI